MITILLEDNIDDHWWKLTCDSCQYTTTYRYSQDISGWVFEKKYFSNVEKHLCPACKMV